MAREIAEAIGVPPGTVWATVHRLRERGELLGYRRRVRRKRSTLPARDGGPECDPAILKPGKASNEEIAGCIGVNVKIRRAESGLTLRQLAEAAETHFSHLSRIERGVSKIPQLALILKLAGSLNVRCGLLTAGVIWDPASGAFLIEECPPAPHTAVDRLGANAKRARLLADLSQQALADRASMSRGDLVDFERGEPELRDLHSHTAGWRIGSPFRPVVCRPGELAHPPACPTGIPARRSADQSRARSAAHPVLERRSRGTGNR
ncbi:MAG TPA: helix-turn-helix domain-containing protein [Solirubrobacterales bacterium]|nr:helix-turn-helix domain-containing protein [Solirubrobacterales bacterium]